MQRFGELEVLREGHTLTLRVVGVPHGLQARLEADDLERLSRHLAAEAARWRDERDEKERR